MSSIQERLQLKRVPLDTWNIREQLCLASAVVRSGDQNWMSVSRALKTVGEPNRPADWYSQKSCAAQYGVLLENVETPKRKKRNSEGAVETPQDSILKKLTQERIVEIQKTVAEMNQQYEQLKNEILEVRNPATTEERLRELWEDIDAAKRAREKEAARRAAWLKEREERRTKAEKNWRPQPTVSPAPPSSPLLTSLLKSSPVVTTPQHISHPANVVETVSPSAGAPTLSLLLEGTPRDGGRDKLAAIEHIKSQLVQIERRFIASTSSPPPPPAVVDIDEIEIKAEDVYAFRDIDIHIPPVTAAPKTKPLEKLLIKKDEVQPESVPTEPVTEIIEDAEDVEKEKPMETEPEAEVISVEEVVPEQPAAPLPPAPEEEIAAPEVKLSFPEVKFPTPEIKVVQQEDVKIKEEVKEAEPPHPETEIQPVEEVVMQESAPMEVDKEQETEESKEEEPKPPLEEPSPEEPKEEENLVITEPTPEERIAAMMAEYPPVPDEVSTEDELQPEIEEPRKVSEKKEDSDERTLEEIKKEEDAEDSIPLMEMMKEESTKEEASSEKKEEKTAEEAHMETDDDTPMELSREEEKDGKKKRDYSRKKKPDSRTCSGSESATEASAPESPYGVGEDRQHRLWKKSIMPAYSRLCQHKFASLFLRPITDDEAPGYSLVVKRPMDLTTIKRNIDSGQIRTTAEFQRDVLLMLTNALMYNSSEHSVFKMAKDMYEEATSALSVLLAAQAHAALSAPRRKRSALGPART